MKTFLIFLILFFAIIILQAIMSPIEIALFLLALIAAGILGK